MVVEDEEGRSLFVLCLYHSFHLTSTITSHPFPMAYNREWDRGKDPWNDNAWSADSRANPRGRDDDYYGEGKRRKFNNGVRIHTLPSYSCYLPQYDYQGFDSSYAYDDGAQNSAYYHKSDYQDYGQDDRHRGGGGFGKKRLIPSEPSPHVIFLGLDPDFTEADVRITCSLSH